ncbi:hypothetical protein [Paenibacillus piri]|uniref:SAM-dependent methyltransferase n=1 Tax=Paenibacillus piri TaxID=2547395 RepID=A0A4V6PIB3_9BACL|nr:hypothetical protein [Paenibacillus piri]TDF89186.1 hypothetical protein E1757_34945 [Paenibacillus piri]
MTYPSYINLTDSFVKGLHDYLKKKEIPLDEVVEVFAGDGRLGLQLGLNQGCNISDLLLYACDGYEDEVNMRWEKEPQGVVKETAYETVVRFGASEGASLRLLIMGAPLPANSYYCPSYQAAKALYHLFNAQILYIGEMYSRAFGSPKFFNHLAIVDDDPDNSFKNLVVDNYDSQNGYFTSAQFEEPVTVRPYLLKFVTCADEKCDCRDGSNIQIDIHNFLSG